MTIYTAPQVGKIVNRCRTAVCAAIRDGRLKATVHGKTYVITEEALNEYKRNLKPKRVCSPSEAVAK
jgi:hypothetical protein